MSISDRFLALLSRSPNLIHVLVVLLVVGYAMVGGAMFMYIEAENNSQTQSQQGNQIVSCLAKTMHRTSHVRRQFGAQLLYRSCVEHHLNQPDWTYSNCVIFAFTIILTIGYHLNPMTQTGQCFFMVFAIIGIPMSVIVLADIGVFVKDAMRKLVTRIHNRYKGAKQAAFEATIGKTTINSQQLDTMLGMENDQSDEDSNSTSNEQLVDMSGSLLLVLFLAYVFIGAIFLLVLHDSSEFIPSLYKIFVVMTGGDFGGMSSGRLVTVLLKLAFAFFGLAISTIAIDVGSAYLKKLHYFGKKFRNCASVIVWFGARRSSVGGIVKAVATRCGMPAAEMKTIDIDDVIDSAIEAEEGKGGPAAPKEEPRPEPEGQPQVDPEPQTEPEKEPESAPDPVVEEPEPEEKEEKPLSHTAQLLLQSAPISMEARKPRSSGTVSKAPNFSQKPRRERVRSADSQATVAALAGRGRGRGRGAGRGRRP